MSRAQRPYLLPESPSVPQRLLDAVRNDYDRFAQHGLPAPLEDYLADRFHVDVTADYAGYELKNPWGKASGQLSMTAHQVAEDVEAGLGFVVLKTVIAQDATGTQTMHDWAIREARMVAEPIRGQSGEQGWTISWKGRGWWQSFDEYLQLIRDAQDVARDCGTLIVPSCKFHLPMPDEQTWKISEYEYTTNRLLRAWRETADDSQAPMPLEKDFSPTLAGSDRATAQAKILEWLRTVPELVRASVSGPLNESSDACGAGALADHPSGGARSRLNTAEAVPPVRLGLKIFNALFNDDFQLDILRAIHEPGPGRPDFYVYANRLFDPQREFDGHQGIAYGGPDLSHRNLRVMTRFQESQALTPPPSPSGTGDGGEGEPLLPWSATGNITTGKTALEYALRGASSFQLHTFFQLPADQYHMQVGSKTEKALHELYFHPETGFIVWLHHLASRRGLATDTIRFREVVGRGRQLSQ